MTDRFRWQAPRKGDVFGRWTLLQIIGEGGNATVWRAGDKDGQEVAVKVLKPPDNAERYERFAQEVRVHLEVLRNTNGVLPLLEAEVPTSDVITTAPWLAMPLADPLALHLGTQPRVEDVIDAAIGLAETLADLLARYGISHRDIKPQNLYWWADAPAIGDFGLVAVPDRRGITREDRDLGPRDYLPPEMRARKPNREGPPADVFELGLTTFALLAAEPPRDGLRQEEESHQLAILHDDPSLRGLDRILQRATAYQPSHRPTMGDLAAELQAWRSPAPTAGGVNVGSFRRRLEAVAVASGEDTRTVESLDELQRRTYEAARPTFEALNSLGLEPTNANVRLFERLDPLGRGLRTGSLLSLQPSGVDGAVWIAGGVAHGASKGSAHVLAGWVVGRHDSVPHTVWRDAAVIAPRSEVGLMRAELLVVSWAAQAELALEEFTVASERAASTPKGPPRDGPDNDPPELLDFRLEARVLDESRRVELIAHAHLADPVAGLAGAGSGSSPTQASIVGPGGEERVLMMSADGNRICGTRWDGFYEGIAYLEPYDPDGRWTIGRVFLADQAGHQLSLGAAELQAAGFDVAVDVLRP